MDSLRLINKYYANQPELKRIVLIHSQCVAAKALELAKKHPELNMVLNFIRDAALIHDIGVFKTKAEDILCFGSEPYLAHGYLGADIIRNEGYPKHALVCERHTGTGISLEEILSKNLPLPPRDMRPVSLEEQLICFADKFYSKTHLNTEKSVDEARNSLARFGENVVIQFDKWCELFL